MLQVERLLRESCQTVLVKARNLLLRALTAEGVIVDPTTLAVSVAAGSTTSNTSSNTYTAALHSSGGGAGGGKVSVGSAYGSLAHSLSAGSEYAAASASSPRLYRRAEAVRALLQDELSDLLNDIILPVSRFK
jgi:hypothetical protein